MDRSEYTEGMTMEQLLDDFVNTWFEEFCEPNPMTWESNKIGESYQIIMTVMCDEEEEECFNKTIPIADLCRWSGGFIGGRLQLEHEAVERLRTEEEERRIAHERLERVREMRRIATTQ